MKKILLLPLVLLFAYACSSSDDTDTLTDNTQNEVIDDPTSEEMDMYAYMGNFVSVAHPTSGKAQVNTEATTLTLQDFMTDNGPVLEVYLSTDINATNYISLGELQGISGTYDYTIPANTNLNTYKYVLIWCVEFSVNFGYAELE